MGSKFWNQVMVLLALAAGTVITRFLPFILFPAGKKQPRFIHYIGKTLPYASIGLLVVYCFKNVEWTKSPFGLPEAASVLFVVLLHRWKHNVLLSIAGGTAVYMLLIQKVVPALAGL